MKDKKFIGWLIIGGVILATTILVFGSTNTSWPAQILAACLGALVTIIATRLLLASQSEIEENARQAEDRAKKEQEKYNSKLKVYSDFVSEMYKTLSDNHVTPDELRELRTKLFATVSFYAEKNVLEEINSKLESCLFKNGKIVEDVDLEMSNFFSSITKILQNDTNVKELPNVDKEGTKKKGNEKKFENNDNKKEVSNDDIVKKLWENFQTLITSLDQQKIKEDDDRKKEELKEKQYAKDQQKEEHYRKEITKEKQFDESLDIMINNEINDEENGLIINQPSDNIEKSTHEAKQDDTDDDKSQYLKEQAWHFNAWGDSQFKQFEELDKEEYELSLVEYGEYWRTNLLKQVEKGDIIMLFRRGGYGYVGAFEAIGRRVFDFEKGEEEILYFDEEKTRPVEDFNKDVEKYDIYKSKEDGATLCSNLIVKCIAYVPDGVGNPGGVYRRTISRYDSHYAWLLKERFQEKGQWINKTIR